MLSEFPLQSPQITRLIQKRGLEGLGMFWALLALTQATDFCIPISGPHFEAFSYQLRISPDDLTAFLADCTEASLLILNQAAAQFECPVMREKRLRRRKAGRSSGKSRRAEQQTQSVEQSFFTATTPVQHAEIPVQHAAHSVEQKKSSVQHPPPPHTPPSSLRDININTQSRAREEGQRQAEGHPTPPDRSTAIRWAMDDHGLDADGAAALVDLWTADRRRKGWRPSARATTDWRADLEFFHISNSRTMIRAPDDIPASDTQDRQKTSLREYLGEK